MELGPICCTRWQVKLQQDVTRWAAEHVDTRSDGTDGSVIRDTLEFVKLLRRTSYELTPADHAVVAFLRRTGTNCYDIASRKIDTEVFRIKDTRDFHLHVT